MDGVRSELEKQTKALMLVCPQAVADSYMEFSMDFAKDVWRLFNVDRQAEEEGKAAGRDAVRAGRLRGSERSALADCKE